MRIVKLVTGIDLNNVHVAEGHWSHSQALVGRRERKKERKYTWALHKDVLSHMTKEVLWNMILHNYDLLCPWPLTKKSWFKVIKHSLFTRTLPGFKVWFWLCHAKIGKYAGILHSNPYDFDIWPRKPVPGH